jgi:hypothetical protein
VPPLTYLRENVLFCLSLLFCVAVVVLVPQINGVMLQTVETPRIANPEGVRFHGLFEQSTAEAAGYLLFLSLLFAGSVAAVLWVLPTSWFQPPYPGAAPGSWRAVVRRGFPVPWWFAPRAGGFLPYSAPWPGFAWAALSILSLLVLPVLVILHVPALAILPVTSFLLFPLLCFLVDRVCVGFYLLVGSAPWPRRWKWGLGPALLGVPALLLCSAFASPIDTPYLSSGCVVPVACLYFFVGGLWLLFPAGQIHTAFGRLLGWVMAASVLGEVVWYAAECPLSRQLMSYRLYTVWAVLQVLVLVILVAAFLDTLERNTQAPWRVLGLAGLIVLFFVSGVPDPEALRDLERSPRGEPVGRDEWAVRLLARIQKVPNNGPAVFVASSGGGSRAAIFAGLVLESLAREPFGTGAGETWGDHVVLVSGVSGGSLGSARYIHGLRPTWTQTYKANDRPSLSNSVRAELAGRMAEQALALRNEVVEEDKGLEKGSDYRVPAEQTLAFCNWFRDHAYDGGLGDLPLPPEAPDLRWVLQSGIMDDLCTDFMAPVLRGVLTPVFSRGETLRRFWRGKFGWDGSRDRDGYAIGGDAPTYASDRFPLALYNTSDVRRGCRLTVGFPPLPSGFLRGNPSDLGPDEVQPWRPQNPPEGLADLDQGASLGLADAVGLSANFPFGFNAVKIPRRQLDDPLTPDKVMTPEQRAIVADGLARKDDLEAKLLDGGIVDNTGIDSLYLVVEALREKAEAAARRNDKEDVYGRIWNELLDRRVYLIEIDSGAKPDKPGAATKYFSLLFDPLAALNNAGYTNASRDKNQYFIDLAARFTDPADLSGPLARLPPDPQAMSPEEKDVRRKLLAIQRGGIPRFAHLTFDANHFAADNVLTAWSLAPSDKALLLVRFMAELQARRPQLADLAELAKFSRAQQRAQLLESADKLLRALPKARASRQLQESLEALERETTEFSQLVRAKKGSPRELKDKLALLQDRLRDAQKQSTVAGIRDAEVQGRLANLQQAVTTAREAVEKEAAVIPPNVLKTLTFSREGDLGQVLAELPGQRSRAISASLRVFDEGSKTQAVQRKITNTTMESRMLFDRPASKK